MNPFSVIAVMGLFLSGAVQADQEGMPHMPLIQPKKTYSVESKDAGEVLLEQRGYGDQEPEVRMMNLMMVEGSGMESMDMGEMKTGKIADAGSSHQGHATQAEAVVSSVSEATPGEIKIVKAPNPAKVGPNLFEFAMTDRKNGKALPGVKFNAEVYMTIMDMGTETPKVKEIKPGVYQVKAVFSMQGPWTIKLITSKGNQVFHVDVSK